MAFHASIGRKTMRNGRLWAMLAASVAAGTLTIAAARAQTLSGQVASDAEPTMEGVLVTAKSKEPTSRSPW